ncbi:hypothetical protein AB1N83_006824 [Pleurotus pulmonarius]
MPHETESDGGIEFRPENPPVDTQGKFRFHLPGYCAIPGNNGLPKARSDVPNGSSRVGVPVSTLILVVDVPKIATCLIRSRKNCLCSAVVEWTNHTDVSWHIATSVDAAVYEPSTVLPSASSPEERTEYKDQLLRRSLPPSNPSILTSKAQADKEFQLLHFLAFALNSVRRASTGTTEASGAHILLP